MKTFRAVSMIGLLVGVAATVHAQNGQQTLVVTASNTTNNQLLVYDATDKLIQTIPTRGQGGASGNAGGVAAQGNMLAVVNFGSENVSVFQRLGNGFFFTQLIPTTAGPVSVAFGNNHLYVLGAAKVESHAMFGFFVNSNPDGVVALLKGDGSSAQVGVVQNQLIITEKTGFIETVNLRNDGAATGLATLVQNIPANPNAPFGLVTRGNNAYVTIAHSNEISLVRNGTVLTTTSTSVFGSNAPQAPCWVTLKGPFLFSSNSPSMNVSRYAVYGQKIVPDAEVAASFNGLPTDIDYGDGLIAVVDGNSAGTSSHLSVFGVDEDGNLTLHAVTTISSAANGVAVIPAPSE